MPTPKPLSFLRILVLIALGLFAASWQGRADETAKVCVDALRGESPTGMRAFLRRLYDAQQGDGPTPSVSEMHNFMARLIVATTAESRYYGSIWTRSGFIKNFLDKNNEAPWLHDALEVAHRYWSGFVEGALQGEEGRYQPVEPVARLDMQNTIGQLSARQDLPTPEESDEVALVVHQISSLQEDTARVLERIPGLQKGARVTLVTRAFRLENAALAHQSSQFRLSFGGEHGLKGLRARRIHMFGGFVGLCFSTALIEVINDFLGNSQRDVLEIAIHTSLTYASGSKILRDQLYIKYPHLNLRMLRLPAELRERTPAFSREPGAARERLRYTYQIGQKTLHLVMI